MIRITTLMAGLALLTPASHGQLFKLTKEQLIDLTKQNPFERFPDGRPKVPDSLIERAKGMSMEEVFAILPGKQFRNQYEGGWQVLYPKKKMVGRAVTVQFMPARPDLDAVVNAGGRITNQTALDLLQPGDVLVVDLFGKGVDATIVGDNLFYYMAKSAKAAGLVVRRDPRSGRDLRDRHAGLLPHGASQLSDERNDYGDQHSGPHRAGDRNAGRPGTG